MPRSTQRESQRLADQLERSFRGGAWHGPALAEVMDGIDEETALRRPAGAAHSIAELVWHVCFWIRRARERMEGDASASGEDWPQGPLSWSRVRGELEAVEADLLATVQRVDDAGLDRPAAGTESSVRGLLLGILQHNAYHAGQIAVLRRGAAS